MTAPTVLTIVLNYKTPDLTIHSVEAAKAAMTGLMGEITVVDNDSQDSSLEFIRRTIETKGWNNDAVPVRIIKAGHNGGFGAGNNIGIRSQLSNGEKPDFYYILNSDAFPEPAAINSLLDHLITSTGTGLCGSYIHGENGEPHITAFRFPTLFSEFEDSISFGPITRALRKYKVTLPQPSHTCTVDWVAGASLMMRREMLDQIGLFDERFFLYFEETDLCRRAAQAGWRTDFVPASIVKHIGSVSTGMNTWERVPDYWFDSRLYYFTKNHGRLYAAATTAVRLVGGSLHKMRCKLTNRDRGVPKKFLRDLFFRDIRAAVKHVLSGARQAPQKESL